MNKDGKNKKIYRILMIIVAVILAIAMMIPSFSYFLPEPAKNEGNQSRIPIADRGISYDEKSEQSITLVAGGDIMAHRPQLAAQFNAASGQYNFDNNFQYIKPYIEKADFAMCNVETTFGGEPYSGYPLFNSPDSLATAIKNAGFDLAFTSNNHMLDTGLKGVERTIKILRENKLLVSGSFLEGEKNYIIADVKGIPTAFIGYTYRTPEVSGYPTVNGNRVTEEISRRINSFGFENLDNDLEQLKNSIKQAKKDGAKLIVTYFHWGIEYQRQENEKQQYIAKKAAKFGSDIIFASHPHVEQPLKGIKIKNKVVPVFYSMGNFLSNQRADTVNNRYAEQGAIARAKIYFKGDKIENIEADIIPTWVNKYNLRGKINYAIIPLDKNFDKNPAILASGNINKARQALNDQIELFGQDKILKIDREEENGML